MKTRLEVVQRAFERLGIARPGAPADPNLTSVADQMLQDMLLALNEDLDDGLDFDPTNDSIPDERVPSLANLFRLHYAPVIGREVSEDSMRIAKHQFFRGVIGPSDYVNAEPRDF